MTELQPQVYLVCFGISIFCRVIPVLASISFSLFPFGYLLSLLKEGKKNVFHFIVPEHSLKALHKAVMFTGNKADTNLSPFKRGELSQTRLRDLPCGAAHQATACCSHVGSHTVDEELISVALPSK